jgi:hypothetical protein
VGERDKKSYQHFSYQPSVFAFAECCWLIPEGSHITFLHFPRFHFDGKLA